MLKTAYPMVVANGCTLVEEVLFNHTIEYVSKGEEGEVDIIYCHLTTNKSEIIRINFCECKRKEKKRMPICRSHGVHAEHLRDDDRSWKKKNNLKVKWILPSPQIGPWKRQHFSHTSHGYRGSKQPLSDFHWSHLCTWWCIYPGIGVE